MPLNEVLRELWMSWTGRIALILLVIQVALAVYVVVTTDYPKLSELYLNENAWMGKYPLHVPPCWAVSKHAQVVTLELNTSVTPPSAKLEKRIGAFIIHNYTWIVVADYEGDAPPSDTLMLVEVWRSNATKAFRVSLSLIRPDGVRLDILPKQPVTATSAVLLGVAGGAPQLLNNLPMESPLAASIISTIARAIGVNATKLSEYGPGAVLWMGPGGSAVKGTYRFVLNVFYVTKGNVSIEKAFNLYMFVKTMPNCYGLMGTDSVGRPVELGILLGLPWSFIISLYVAFLSVMIGGLYGILAGVASGWKAELLMRIADVVYSMPFLPILIVVVMVTGNNSIWVIMTVMVALLWVGPVIVVRSMALQIKEQPYIETARAVGVGTLRIIFRYIFPQVLPYLVALMVLGIPDPILTEAALAFLGLSDPTIPTWGKMLEYAWIENAVINGWWWDFIFPGLALSVFCATFLMLGRALEPIVAPRIRRG